MSPMTKDHGNSQASQATFWLTEDKHCRRKLMYEHTVAVTLVWVDVLYMYDGSRDDFYDL